MSETMQPYGERTSKAAVASVLFAILGVCPLVLVGGLLALLFGGIGYVNAGKPGYKGRGWAVTGMLLGILTLTFWGTGAWLMWGVATHGKAVHETAVGFLEDVGRGDVARARARSMPPMDEATIRTLVDLIRMHGPQKELMVTGYRIVNDEATIRAGVTFGSTPMEAEIHMTYVDGEWRVRGATITPAARP